MLVSIIVAMDCQGLIGTDGGLPWRLSRDLRRFRALTLGKPVLMGRRTFESIGKPLPERLNIILTQDATYRVPGCQVAGTLPEALSIAAADLARTGKEEAMIIGGGTVYREAIDRWDRLYLTLVEGKFQGTTYFPIRELLRQKWRPIGESEHHPADEKNQYPHSFHVLERARDTEPSCSGKHPPAIAPEGPLDAPLDGNELAALLSRGTVTP